MGWFKKVFKVLGNGDEDEAPRSDSVELAKLPEWIDHRASLSFERIKPKIEDLFSEFFDERRSLMKNLNELQMAQLHNPNIPQRELSIMEGNRNEYISKNKQFANMLEFPTDLTLSGTSFFCKSFEEMLVGLAKGTGKGHAVTSQFFGDHVNKINRNVKGMSDRINKIGDTLDESDINADDLDRLRRMAIDLKTKKKHITDLEQETKLFQTKLANSNSYKDKLMKKMEELKLTDGYAQFKRANKDKEDHVAEMKRVEEEVHAYFAAIQRPMKKYERVLAENVELFKKYIDDPIGALVDDENITIAGTLHRMKRAVMEGTLGFDDKEQEKVSNKIDSISGDKLSSLRSRYVDAKTAARKIDNEIRMNSTLQELDDLNYKVEHTNGQINILEDKIDKARKSLDKVDLEKMRAEVVTKVAEVLHCELEITWHQPESMVETEQTSA